MLRVFRLVLEHGLLLIVKLPVVLSGHVSLIFQLLDLLGGSTLALLLENVLLDLLNVHFEENVVLDLVWVDLRSACLATTHRFVHPLVHERFLLARLTLRQ